MVFISNNMSGKYPKKRCLYTTDAIQKALTAINTSMSINAASKKFNIPRTTLDAKKKKKLYAEKKPGPSTVLSNEEEKTLVEWIFHLSRKGFSVTKKSAAKNLSNNFEIEKTFSISKLLDSVQMLIKSLQRKTIFVNDRPGRH